MANIQGGKTYKLKNAKAHTVVDLSGTDNTSVIGWDDNNTENQKWNLEWTGAHWAFKNKGNGRYLGINGQVKDGTPLSGVDNRVEWDIYPDERNASLHRIYVPGASSPMNMDLAEHGNAKPGTPVTIWTKWEGENQAWQFEEV
ncbi:hypothetical protein Hypma_010813 [Hypsizygus marmoreus]|uniref:Ricin B lectin domain-containing protein n=1 Tax=Hypsizygus marmoreus TaxID=39966 RepID=A0A369JQQ2_HYPMA|nr:hypothetical protein Hypma_010813 [Hypsizygus marmoreus]